MLGKVAENGFLNANATEFVDLNDYVSLPLGFNVLVPMEVLNLDDPRFPGGIAGYHKRISRRLFYS